MVRKIVYGVGIFMALMAAEGLSRFGSLVSAFGGFDAGFYESFLLVAVFAAGVLLAAFFEKVDKTLKILTFVALLICSLLMLGAPYLPVTSQVITGLLLSATAVLSSRLRIATQQKSRQPSSVLNT